MKNNKLQAWEIFELHAARAFFGSAWAEACEEAGETWKIAGREILEVMPADIDPAAISAARTLRMDMERVNNVQNISALMTYILEQDDEGDRPRNMETFGHYAAMQAMGEGVGLYDAFGKTVYENVRVPYVEFGFHSLERDYFEGAADHEND